MMFVTDLDDTLYKEIDYVDSGFRAIGEALAKEGILSRDETVDFLHSCTSNAEAFEALAARIAVDRPRLRHAHPSEETYRQITPEWIVEVYKHQPFDIHCSDGVLDTLQAIKAAGIPIGIITDGRSYTQRAKIKALGLDEFVAPENILISEETGYNKTTLSPFKKMMELNPEQTSFVYVGDNPAKDFGGPNELGWLSVMLLDPGHRNIHSQDIQVPEHMRPQHNIKTFAEVLPLIGIG